MDSKQKYKVIGLMSGTSLDGVDIAYCRFEKKGNWEFSIDKAETVPYTKSWRRKLSEAHNLEAEKLAILDAAYGKFLGTLCKNFILKHKIKSVNFIASHGHTVFHQPENGFTTQIGDGNHIHAATGLPVIFDFRSLDVAHGGQGAPLVPIGDELLFDEYDVCLNLGGIANLSLRTQKKRAAFDVCFVNMGLNYLAGKVGKEYDQNGKLASDGEINNKLLTQLEQVYRKVKSTRPSLGREFFEKHIQPLLDRCEASDHDQLRTFTESAAREIAEAILKSKNKPMVLCTGGGTYNSFLIYRLMELSGDDTTLIIPEDEVIKYKEALVFAFLGVLRSRGEINCLKSVTGASLDSSSGVTVGF
jgi:anhydro-N-acetylmuramic acid kinase